MKCRHTWRGFYMTLPVHQNPSTLLQARAMKITIRLAGRSIEQK